MGNMFANHYREVTATKEAKRAAADGSDSMEGHTIHEQLLAQLATHVQQLKNVQSMQRKLDMKKEFAPTYDAYIQAQLAEEPAKQDPILTQVMIWLADIGEYERAMEIALYAHEYQLDMPQRFNRDVSTWMTDTFADAAIAAEKAGATDGPTLLMLKDISEATVDDDMPDEARAKLHKAMGVAYQALDPDENEGCLVDALFHLNRALELDRSCGVKKRRDTLAKVVNAPPVTDDNTTQT